ncbi:hypothetical protein Ssi02_53820 [Sinosporangium siamense]|uniref:Uncharacterized protein n=1 Tax=Sinosporangium siamense TaxID=1367973 RepID=A0A919RJU0_9ACTN|nr:hypothetical protein Ssi02_53820 [Sinosporangium siamense]
MDDPGYLGLRIGDLLGRAVVVVGVDAESGRLPFHPALRVLISAFGFRTLTYPLRADEELVGAVAYPGDSDGRVNFVDGRQCSPFSSRGAVKNVKSRPYPVSRGLPAGMQPEVGECPPFPNAEGTPQIWISRLAMSRHLSTIGLVAAKTQANIFDFTSQPL